MVFCPRNFVTRLLRGLSPSRGLICLTYKSVMHACCKNEGIFAFLTYFFVQEDTLGGTSSDSIRYD